MERVFLPWTESPLPQVVEWILGKYSAEGQVDLRQVILAVPGRRAGRRLLELLVTACEERSLALEPPQLETAGTLPERLYEARLPFADELTQQMSWVQALRSLPPDELRQLVRRPPEPADLFGWLSLAEMLSGVHRELAADALDFPRVVAHLESNHAAESQRWQVLAEVQRRYLDILDAEQLWDRQTARLYAIAHAECRTEHDVILIGTVDLNQTQRSMVDQVENRVTAIVFAPPELASRFDGHGCLLPDAWQDSVLPVSMDRVHVAEGPSDQAAAVAEVISSTGSRYRSDSITVGVPEEALVPLLEQRMRQCGVPVRYGVGRSIQLTGPLRLLRAVAGFLETRSAATLKNLIRHPALEQWCTAATGTTRWQGQLEDWLSQKLPVSAWSMPQSARSDFPEAALAMEQLAGLLDELTVESSQLRSWPTTVTTLLSRVYGERHFDPADEEDRQTVLACRSLMNRLQQMHRLADGLQRTLSGTEALRLLLQMVRNEMVPAPADPAAVELLGWLELPLDDAPCLIVTGFNEGAIPSFHNSDLFLPNELRHQLGLEDNRRRYARDAYSLELLARSRKELHLIAGRRSASGDPLVPSRLLLACDDDELPQRVLMLFGDAHSPSEAQDEPPGLRFGSATPRFTVPQPAPLAEPVESMRVTEFRDFLACPYRYYLRHRLRLRQSGDLADELDASLFGSLVHEVLKDFRQSSARLCTDEREIRDALDASLDEYATSWFGSGRLPAVAVQVEQIRHRLHAFATWQARRSAEGWVIEHAEISIRGTDAPLDVDGQPLYLRGQIDRIDVNHDTGQVAILDYKTGDAGLPPEKTHRDSEGFWKDLQLPLYRHLAQSLLDTDEVLLGYIVLPKDVSKAGSLTANWTDDDLRHADETAADVVRSIREQRFWPRNPEPPAFSEEFAAICQDGLTRPTDEADNDFEPGA